MSVFQKATKGQRSLKMAVYGPSGAGKTFTALSIAKAIGGKVAVIDTERGSASLYVDNFDFDTAQLATYDADSYAELIRDADSAGYTTIIIDSLSHAWEGPGGILETVEAIKARKGYRDGMRAWNDVKPIEDKLWSAILDARAGIICTMRAKTAYEISKDDRGKTTVEKLGLAPIQRSGKEYEFDVVARMDSATMVIDKTRCTALDGKVFHKPGADVAAILSQWLGAGGEPQAQLEPAQVAQDDPVASLDDATTQELCALVNELRDLCGIDDANEMPESWIEREVVREGRDPGLVREELKRVANGLAGKILPAVKAVHGDGHGTELKRFLRGRNPEGVRLPEWLDYYKELEAASA